VRLDVLVEVITARESLAALRTHKSFLSCVSSKMALKLVRSGEGFRAENPSAGEGSFPRMPSKMSFQVRGLAVDFAAAWDMADVLTALVGGGVGVGGCSVLAVGAFAPAATPCRHALAVFEEGSGNLGVVVGVGGGGGVVGGGHVGSVELGVMLGICTPLLREREGGFLELVGVVVPPSLVVLGGLGDFRGGGGGGRQGFCRFWVWWGVVVVVLGVLVGGVCHLLGGGSEGEMRVLGATQVGFLGAWNHFLDGNGGGEVWESAPGWRGSGEGAITGSGEHVERMAAAGRTLASKHVERMAAAGRTLMRKGSGLVKHSLLHHHFKTIFSL